MQKFLGHKPEGMAIQRVLIVASSSAHDEGFLFFFFPKGEVFGSEPEVLGAKLSFLLLYPE